MDVRPRDVIPAKRNGSWLEGVNFLTPVQKGEEVFRSWPNHFRFVSQ